MVDLFLIQIYNILNVNVLDFPGGSVVKNPPASAGDTGSIPDSGKIPHAAEQLSPWATTTGSVL